MSDDVEVPHVGTGRTDRAVRRAKSQAFAVHHHGRRDDETPGEAALPQRAEQRRGADVVVGHVPTDVTEVDTEPDPCRLVAHGIDAAHGVGNSGAIE